jgi:hypothetical protein
MPQSTIKVQKSGKPLSGARVVLSFSGGQTHEAYTDGQGNAKVDHASSGEATIFVNGSETKKMKAPGSMNVSVT